MSLFNYQRNGCKDVFNAFLVKNAKYDSKFDIPLINSEYVLPKKLIAFSKAVSATDYDCFVHFYEDDVSFERLWRQPKKYLQKLKKYQGVITPDFSVYRDMPFAMQQWNIYRSRALGVWLQENNVPTIVNIRWGDERTYRLSCAGVEPNGIIAVGSHGCIKNNRDRSYFSSGLSYVVNSLNPKTVIVYGSTPDAIFRTYKRQGIQIVQFDSDFAISHQKTVNF